jgi:hypothetical protein
VPNNFIPISLLISYETDSFSLQLSMLKWLNIITFIFDVYNKSVKLPPCLSTAPQSFIWKIEVKLHAWYNSAL